MAERHEVVLTGCNPTPLAGYLKGLGVLRILSDYDPTLKGAWSGQHFRLTSSRPLDLLRHYLLEEYAPTPIVAPWNGGSGFYEKDNKNALQAITSSNTRRFAAYRNCINIVECGIHGLPRHASPKDEAKNQLLVRLRNLLPDDALVWFDAAIMLAGGKQDFPPLLGTGGNDGRLDFTNNFMQRLLDLIDPYNGAGKPESREWLDLALLGKPAPGLVKQAIGQFAPGRVGGPNSTTGYDAKGNINPWDFVLLIEGALPFAAAAVRRNEQGGDGVLSYPFTVRAVAAGSGNLGVSDTTSSRGELWMPLWSKAANYAEIRALLAEGRVALGTRPAKDALDFVRAVHRLGGYRGVDRFQRYGLLMRSGKAYLATPLEQVQITANPESEWTDELESKNWLPGFKKFTQDKNAPNRFIALRHRLENLLFTLAKRKPSPDLAQMLLVLLGEIQTELAHSAKARGSIHPIPQLSERWVLAADDNSTVFRIACALAGLRGIDTNRLPLRSQLFPIHHTKRNDWLEKARKDAKLKDDPACRIRLHLSPQGDLTELLITLLQCRLSLPARLDFKDKPLNSVAGVDLADLSAFLIGGDNSVDSGIAALLPGLSLCKIPDSDVRKAGEGEIHAAYALCKLALTPNATLRGLGLLGKEQSLPGAPHLVSKLATGNPEQARQAIEIAWRRLRGSGLDPVMPFGQLPHLAGIDARRLAAALLIPLNFGATGALARAVLKNDELNRNRAKPIAHTTYTITE